MQKLETTVTIEGEEFIPDVGQWFDHINQYEDFETPYRKALESLINAKLDQLKEIYPEATLLNVEVLSATQTPEYAFFNFNTDDLPDADDEDDDESETEELYNDLAPDAIVMVIELEKYEDDALDEIFDSYNLI